MVVAVGHRIHVFQVADFVKTQSADIEKRAIEFAPRFRIASQKPVNQKLSKVFPPVLYGKQLLRNPLLPPYQPWPKRKLDVLKALMLDIRKRGMGKFTKKVGRDVEKPRDFLNLKRAPGQQLSVLRRKPGM
jgi:hypothetical protein